MSDKELFIAALEVTASDLAQFLQQKAEDADQRKRVEALLKAHLEAGPFLREKTGEQPLTDPVHVAPQSFGSDQEGQVIGQRYKLIAPIGEGGMGAVWKAEQLEPVRRLVAVKLIKPGMDSQQVLARFDAERQALALMDHPHIARILDGGAMADGRPYFVMELVRGIPVTRYCDDKQLSIKHRLQLFTQICQAVQHAHQKGILHRDLKPSNLLVMEQEGKSVPKVIDFGLAKAIQPSLMLTEQTLHTSLGTVVGTPLYMAPEQVEQKNLDVDTRADIFALGVVLYELLTGTTPLERERFRTAAWDEVKRLIQEEEPPKPSTRLSSTDSLPSIAVRRDMEPARLGRFLRGDLDWIVMKTLEKDRNRRYASANALAEDVNRFLNNEPVSAGPPSASYKIRKFVRRHRGAVLAAAAMVLLLLAGIIGTTWGMILAWKQRDRAELAEKAERLQREQTEQASNITKVVNNFLLDDLLGQANMSRQPKEAGERSADLKVRTLVDRAAAKIEGKFNDAPFTEMAIRTTLGGVYESLGLYIEAEKHLLRAVELGELHLDANHEKRIQANSNMAYLRERQGQYEEAARLRESTVKKETEKKGADHPDTLHARLREAKLLNKQRKPADAEKLVREVLTHVKQLPPLSVAMAQHELASALDHQERYTEAEPLFRQALAVRLKELGADHHDVISNQENLGLNLMNQGKLADAKSLFETIIAIRESKLGADHPDTLVSRGNYALLLKKMGKHDEAIALFTEVLQQKVKKHGPDHPTTLATRFNLACYFDDLKQYAQAEPLFMENVDYCVSKLGPSHVNTLRTKMALAQVYLNVKKYVEAEPLFRECLEARDKYRLFGANPDILEQNLGIVLHMQGKYTEAEPLLLRAYEMITPDKYKDAVVQRPRIAGWLATLYEKTGKPEEAAKWKAKVQPVSK
ncbi:MAG TPA: serine/threonine-protein kinase [Gemmatales bacterium]|nr:serine/threonine-protein kinase [Gemmatales bacterium]